MRLMQYWFDSSLRVLSLKIVLNYLTKQETGKL